MMRSMHRAVIVGLLAWAPGTGLARGEPLWVTKAKELGFPAQNCRYCHTEPVPQKETFTPDELNARGKWLLSEKTKYKTEVIDLRWLRQYPGGKKQQ